MGTGRARAATAYAMARMNTDAHRLLAFRPWFYAAAVYNLAWGTTTVLFPRLYFDLIGMPPPEPIAIWQVVGMILAVYATAFWWAARHPERHPHLIVVPFLGKALGPIGFLYAWATGDLPLAFGWTLITNDLVWLPAFGLYLHRSARTRGGWRRFLAGA